MLGGCLVGAWWVLGGCLVGAWWVLGGCLVGAWWVLGGCLVGAWWVLADASKIRTGRKKKKSALELHHSWLPAQRSGGPAWELNYKIWTDIIHFILCLTFEQCCLSIPSHQHCQPL